jgi:hypothetical protein
LATSGVHGHEREGKENLGVTEAISRDELETFSEEKKMGRIRLKNEEREREREKR